MPRHLLIALSLAVLTGCATQSSLERAFAPHFAVGATLNTEMVSDTQHPVRSLVLENFNVITLENDMKWGVMNPEPDTFRFEAADAFSNFGGDAMQRIGHTLFWHSQTPDWVFQDANGAPLKREALLARMRARAQLMARRYGERIKTWDVVNEAILEDGSLRDSQFRKIIGEDWVAEAFRIAAEELPANAQLLYNDYGMNSPQRRDAVLALVADLKARGIRIDGIGLQGHWSMEDPTPEAIEEIILSLARAGLPLHVTELDVDFLGRAMYWSADISLRQRERTPENDPYPDGKLPPEAQERLAARYAEIFAVLVKHSDKIARVTFWGTTDAYSWLNDWPIKGRTNFPLLFDRAGQPKPAYYRVLETAKGNSDAAPPQGQE